MPLEPGKSREAVGGNIKREEEAGKPKKQAIAIALKKAGLSNQESMEDDTSRSKDEMEKDAKRKLQETYRRMRKRGA